MKMIGLQKPRRCTNTPGHGQTEKESNVTYPTNLFPPVSLSELKALCLVTPNFCWEWQGVLRKGYATLSHNGRSFSVHRVTCFLAHGEPQENHFALHSCDNRKCINPDHLRWGTHEENMQDSVLRNRRAVKRGEKNGRAKINEGVVKAIRAIYGTGPTTIQIAELYGISNQMVSRIIQRKAWSHVENW